MCAHLLVVKVHFFLFTTESPLRAQWKIGAVVGTLKGMMEIVGDSWSQKIVQEWVERKGSIRIHRMDLESSYEP